MMERLVYEDTDKRIYVTQEATEDTPQVERYEWLRDTPDRRLAALEAEVRGMKERAAAEASKASPTAKGVAEAVTGPTA